MSTRGNTTTRVYDRNGVASTSSQRTDEGDAFQLFGDEIALAYPQRVFERNSRHSMVISAGTDWYSLFMRSPDCDDEILTAIQNKMNDLYSQKNVASMKARNLWFVGVPCAARFFNDNKWYRARIEDVDYNMVRFVDYGNAQLCDQDDIKPLTRALADISPPACIRCTITEAQDISCSWLYGLTDRINMHFLTAVEPYEVTVQNSAINGNANETLSSTTELIQMIKDNLLNERHEALAIESALEGRLLDLDDELVITADQLQSTVEIEIINQDGSIESISPSKSVVNGQANTSAEGSKAKSAVDNFFSRSASRTVDRREVACQTDCTLIRGEEFEELERCRRAATEDLQKLRKDEKEISVVMKLAMVMNKNFGEMTKFLKIYEDVE